MKEGPDIARVAALIGDPARANILTALMSGKALTASELAQEAGVTPQTASAHIAKLEAGGLIRTDEQGRHKYLALAGPEVASVLEALMGLAAATGQLRTRPGPRDPALRKARVCYNHLAGDMGVALFDRFIAQGVLSQTPDSVTLTDTGIQRLNQFGIDVDQVSKGRGPACRKCLDWSERRHHIGGPIGRALLSEMEKRRWVRRLPDSRVLQFSPTGMQAFRTDLLGS